MRPEKVFFLIFISTFFQNLVQFFIEESSFLRSSDISYIGFRDTEELDEARCQTTTPLNTFCTKYFLSLALPLSDFLFLLLSSLSASFFFSFWQVFTYFSACLSVSDFWLFLASFFVSFSLSLYDSVFSQFLSFLRVVCLFLSLSFSLRFSILSFSLYFWLCFYHSLFDFIFLPFFILHSDYVSLSLHFLQKNPTKATKTILLHFKLMWSK